MTSMTCYWPCHLHTLLTIKVLLFKECVCVCVRACLPACMRARARLSCLTRNSLVTYQLCTFIRFLGYLCKLCPLRLLFILET
jgi:hypothetical protein